MYACFLCIFERVSFVGGLLGWYIMCLIYFFFVSLCEIKNIHAYTYIATILFKHFNVNKMDTYWCLKTFCNIIYIER